MMRDYERSKVTGEPMVPVLWIDLDGTVRHGFDELGRFVNSPDDVVIFDGVPEALRAYKDAGWRIVGVTNQGGVAMGHVTHDDMVASALKSNRLCGRVFDRIFACTHHPDAPDPENAVCWCRKPRIGGLIETARDLSWKHKEIYPPHLGLFVGDREEDRQCAENAGLRFMWAKEWRVSWRGLLGGGE